MNARFSLEFAVYVDDKSHLWLKVDIREYVPERRVWLIAAECQRWRGEYLGEGRYEQGHALGQSFAINARAESIDETLRMLCDQAVKQSIGGAE